MGIRDFAINGPQNKPEKSFPQGPDKTEMRLSGLYTGIQMQKKISKNGNFLPRNAFHFRKKSRSGRFRNKIRLQNQTLEPSAAPRGTMQALNRTSAEREQASKFGRFGNAIR